MEIIERSSKWSDRYARWQHERGSDAMRQDEYLQADYPFIVNQHAPFVPLGRALPMLNLALVTSAGAYIDGTEAFDTVAAGGDASFREIPIQIEAEDLLFAARGFDPAAVRQDANAQVPLTRLLEFAGNGIIGGTTQAFWSFCGHIPDANRLVEESLPRLVERVKRYEGQAALLIPASRLCHQSMALAARALEMAGIPTMMLAVGRDVIEGVRPPRAGYYNGEFGSVAGRPGSPEHQRRVLDESLRLLEPMDQVTIRKLVVDLETSVEVARGEK